VALALSALRREAWLCALGLAVTGLRRALAWPALAVGWALLIEGAFGALRADPLDPLAPVEGAMAVASSVRFLSLAGGLWLAGAVAGGALRLAWISGALSVLGARMAGEPLGTRGFAQGVARSLPRVLAAAMLAFVLELSGAIFSVTLLLGAIRITGRAAGTGAGPLLAAAVALALTLAAAVPVALSAAADAAVARAALRDEGPAEALAAVARRFLARPGTFILAALVFGAATAIGPASVEAAGSLFTGFAGEAPAVIVLGPGLMLAALAALVATAVDLAWLGTVAVLACADG
jgi:hypothetical protein